MSISKIKKLTVGATAMIIALSTAIGAVAETKLWSTVESRIILGFKADDAAVQATMPEGWKAITLPKGPLAGINLLLVFMDRHLILDAEGKPMDPSANPVAALMSYGVSKDVEGVRGYITHIYEIPPAVNPYGNSSEAMITRQGGKSVDGDSVVSRIEDWSLKTEAGGMVDFKITYTSAGLNWTEGGVSRPYSSAMPEYSHIYRYDQTAELVMNTTSGYARPNEWEFSASGGEFADLFDGSEALVAVLNIPVYVRDVFEP